jgi:predicted transcriptional regulator
MSVISVKLPEAEIEAGLAELDAGAGMPLEDYEREMDAFMAKLQAGHR